MVWGIHVRTHLVHGVLPAVHKLILGQTLTTDTSANGGSLAQAKVHAGVETSQVMAHARFVCNILNEQLVPAIVAKNYGRLSGLPLPEIMVSVPEAAQSKDKIDFYDGVINRLGLTVTRSKLYDDLGVAQPAPDDDVVGPAQQPQGAFGGFPSIGAGMPNLEAAAAARAAFSSYPARDVDNAEALANKAGAAWLEPIFAALLRRALR